MFTSNTDVAGTVGDLQRSAAALLKPAVICDVELFGPGDLQRSAAALLKPLGYPKSLVLFHVICSDLLQPY